MSTAISGEILSEWFVAKITAVGAAVGAAPCNGIPHGWTTMKPCDNWSKYRDQAGYPVISGTTTNVPAYAIDGSAASVNDIVLMRYRARPSGMPVMEFIKSGGGGGTPVSQTVVTAVTCSNGTLTVTTKTLTVPGMVVT